jgi:hypothetical protein
MALAENNRSVFECDNKRKAKPSRKEFSESARSKRWRVKAGTEWVGKRRSSGCEPWANSFLVNNRWLSRDECSRQKVVNATPWCQTSCETRPKLSNL